MSPSPVPCWACVLPPEVTGPSLSCALLLALPTGHVDGILRTFDLFMAYSPGYFVVDIMARDLAGHNDTAIIGIYILRDDQRVKIVINEIPDRVRSFEEEFIRLLSNITGAIVNTDDVQVPSQTPPIQGSCQGRKPDLGEARVQKWGHGLAAWL